MKKIWSFILIPLFLTNIALSKEEKICYLVEYFFIDVAKVCITYKFQSNIETYVKANTVGLVKILKNISYYGYSKAEKNFRPLEFYFNQKEKNLHVIHHYIFRKDFIKIKKIINKKKFFYFKKIKENFYLDPFSASIFLFNKIQKGNKEGILTIFYNGKIYEVPYKVKRKEDYLEVEIDPKIEVEGIIKPKGKWYLYFKEKEKYPFKMKLRILIGEIRLKRIE